MADKTSNVAEHLDEAEVVRLLDFIDHWMQVYPNSAIWKRQLFGTLDSRWDGISLRILKQWLGRRQ